MWLDWSEKNGKAKGSVYTNIMVYNASKKKKRNNSYILKDIQNRIKQERDNDHEWLK